MMNNFKVIDFKFAKSNDEFDEKYVWYRGNSMTGTKPVGEKLPNRWEL